MGFVRSTRLPSRREPASHRTTVRIAAVAGACLLAVTVWWSAPWTTARAVTLAGTAVASGDGTAISFAADSRLQALRHGMPLRGDMGFSVEGVHWAGPDGRWRDGGSVDCLAPMAPTRVEVTFTEVHYGDGDGGPTHPLLALRCLDQRPEGS